MSAAAPLFRTLRASGMRERTHPTGGEVLGARHVQRAAASHAPPRTALDAICTKASGSSARNEAAAREAFPNGGP